MEEVDILEKKKKDLFEEYEKKKNYDDYLGEESGGLWGFMSEEEKKLCLQFDYKLS